MVIEHDHVSPPGAIGERFIQRGYAVVEHVVVGKEYFHIPAVTAAFPSPTDFDAIVAMGAPWSVYADEAVGSWVRPELDLLRTAHAEGVPVLGICFGGQLLASAHGGTVEASDHPELGWTEVSTDDPELVPAGPWFQWHSDRWTVPPSAVEVARNPAASQAFVLGRNLAVQFHPELDAHMLRLWLGNGGAPILAERGVDLEHLISATEALEAHSRARARRLVDAFLDRVALA